MMKAFIEGDFAKRDSEAAAEAPGNNLDLRAIISYLWLAGDEDMEKYMETTIMGYIGTTIRTHSFITSQPKAGLQ